MDNAQDITKARLRNLEAAVGVQFENKANGGLSNAGTKVLECMFSRADKDTGPTKQLENNSQLMFRMPGDHYDIF